MKKLSLFLIICCLCGCGFSPLYVQKTGDSKWYYNDEFNISILQEMQKVKVEIIPERFGQLLRNVLLDNLTPKGVPSHPQYRLYADLTSKRTYDQAMRDDITSTRKMVIYTVTYYMTENGKTLFKNKSVAYSSYDILKNPYSTTIAEKKADEEAAKIIGDDITLRVGAYFHTKFTKMGVIEGDL